MNNELTGHIVIIQMDEECQQGHLTNVKRTTLKRVGNAFQVFGPLSTE